MSVMLLLMILFTIGAGLVAFSRRPDVVKTGFILEFVAALIATIMMLMGRGGINL